MKTLTQFIVISFIMLITGMALAGNVRGPQSNVDAVDPYSSDTYVMVFEADRSALIMVNGDHSTDLDCYLYDGNENLILEDSDSTDICKLRWTPAWEGKFRMVIKNRGGEINIYKITTN